MSRSYRRPFRSVSILGAFGVLSGASAFLAQVFFARAWDPAEFGAFATAFSTIAVVAPLAAFGVGFWWLQIFAQEGRAGIRWLGPSVRFALTSTLAAVVLVLVWGWFGTDGLQRQILLLLTPVIGLYAGVSLVQARYQLEERYAAVAIVQVIPNGTRVLIGLMVAVLGYGAVRASVLFAVLAALVIIGCAWSIGRMARSVQLIEDRAGLPQASPTAPTARAVAQKAWPYGVGGVMYMILYQSDIIVLGNLDEVAAASYAVCVTFIGAFYILPNVLFQLYLRPKLHRWAHHDRRLYLAVYRFGTTAMTLCGIALLIGVLLFGAPIVRVVFGADYGSLGPLIAILAFALPIRFAAASIGGVLVASDHMKTKAQIHGLAAAANLSLNLALIPQFGAYAAAFTTVACELAQLCAFLWVVRSRIFGADAWRGFTLDPASLDAPDTTATSDSDA